MVVKINPNQRRNTVKRLKRIVEIGERGVKIAERRVRIAIIELKKSKGGLKVSKAFLEKLRNKNKRR